MRGVPAGPDMIKSLLLYLSAKRTPEMDREDVRQYLMMAADIAYKTSWRFPDEQARQVQLLDIMRCGFLRDEDGWLSLAKDFEKCLNDNNVRGAVKDFALYQLLQHNVEDEWQFRDDSLQALLRRLEEDYRPQSRNWNLLQGPMSKVFALAQEEAAKQDGSEMQL